MIGVQNIFFKLLLSQLEWSEFYLHVLPTCPAAFLMEVSQRVITDFDQNENLSLEDHKKIWFS